MRGSGPERPELPQRQGDPVGVRGHGSGRHPPRVRLPGRERAVRGDVQRSRGHVHRPHGEHDAPHGRQGPGAPRHGEGRRPRRARQRGDRPRPGPRGRGSGEHRLSGHDQGVGRRRRQGNARRVEPGRARRRLSDRARRGGVVVRKRRPVRREAAHRAASHRVPDPRRQVRERRAPGGEGLLHPAAPPEAHRGVAVARDDPRASRADGRGGDARREGDRLRQRGNGRVPSGLPGRLSLHGDEHEDPGGASGHRARHRRRSREGADPHRGRRAHSVHAGRRGPARPRHRVPHQRRGPGAGDSLRAPAP